MQDRETVSNVPSTMLALPASLEVGATALGVLVLESVFIAIGIERAGQCLVPV